MRGSSSRASRNDLAQATDAAAVVCDSAQMRRAGQCPIPVASQQQGQRKPTKTFKDMRVKVFYNYFGVVPWLGVFLLGLLLAACDGCRAQESETVIPVTGATPVVVSVAVGPARAPIPIAGVQAFTATAIYSDGSSRDVTGTARWTSGDVGVASIVPTSGLATGLASGTTRILASYAGKTDATTLTVTATTLVSVRVTPIRSKLHMGIQQGLLASALFSDGSVRDVTTTAVWTSRAPLVAAVVAGNGVVTGISAGSAQVTVAFGGKTAVASVTVPNAVLAAIAVTPATATAQIGGTTQFVAMGTFSDGSQALLGTAAIWSSANPLIASVAPTSGQVAALSAGTAHITATWEGKTATAVMVVSGPDRRVSQSP